jgi:toxin-antitoxin system PIN domain toxin
MNAGRFLVDVNILVALFDTAHSHHRMVVRWFSAPGLKWGVCAFTEAGFLRIATSTRAGRRTVEQATNIVKSFSNDPNFSYWPIRTSWPLLAEPFHGRLYGHQQITDAYLLGLAIKEDAILVTLDKAMKHLAGPKYSKHLLTLE